MNEPTTVLTDYALGAVAAWASVRLFSSAERSRRYWALAFAALAAGAFLGGTWHGFVRSDLLWKDCRMQQETYRQLSDVATKNCECLAL